MVASTKFSCVRAAVALLALTALFFLPAVALGQTPATVEVNQFVDDPGALDRLAANVTVTLEPIQGVAIVTGTSESTEPGQMVFTVEFTPSGATEPTTYQFTANQTDLTESQMPIFVGVAVAVGQGGGGEEPIPPAPTGLIATVSDIVHLDWAFQEADHFNIYRSETPGGPYVLVDTSSTVFWEDTTVVSDTQYYYIVRAANSQDDESPDSNEVGAYPSLPLKNSPAFYLNTIKPGTFTIDGANLIAQANDSSGNNRHVAQAADDDKPTLVNGHTMSFDGNRWLEISSNYTIGDIFFIVNPTTTNSRDILGKFISGTGRINKNAVFQAISESNITPNVDFQINGVDAHFVNRGVFSFVGETIVVRATPQTPLSADALALGRGVTLTSSLFDGTLRDVIIYPSEISAQDASDLTDYLINKASIDNTKAEVVNIQTTTTSSNSASTISDFAAPALENGALYVLISSTITHSPTGVTWQGNNLTQIASYTETNGSNVSIWRYLLGASSIAQFGNIVATFNNSGRHGVAAILLYNVNQSTPEVDSDGLTALATTPLQLALSSSAKSIVLDVVHWTGGGSSSGSVGANQVQIMNTGGQVGMINRQERASYKRGDASSTTMEQTRTTPTEGSYMGLATASP